MRRWEEEPVDIFFPRATQSAHCSRLRFVLGHDIIRLGPWLGEARALPVPGQVYRFMEELEEIGEAKPWRARTNLACLFCHWRGRFRSPSREVRRTTQLINCTYDRGPESCWYVLFRNSRDMYNYMLALTNRTSLGKEGCNYRLD